jgi:hypothetical protein
MLSTALVLGRSAVNSAVHLGSGGFTMAQFPTDSNAVTKHCLLIINAGSKGKESSCRPLCCTKPFSRPCQLPGCACIQCNLLKGYEEGHMTETTETEGQRYWE